MLKYSLLRGLLMRRQNGVKIFGNLCATAALQNFACLNNIRIDIYGAILLIRHHVCVWYIIAFDATRSACEIVLKKLLALRGKLSRAVNAMRRIRHPLSCSAAQTQKKQAYYQGYRKPFLCNFYFAVNATRVSKCRDNSSGHLPSRRLRARI